MIAMGMMQPSIHEVIDMIPMGDRLMATIWTMLMRCIMPFRRAIGRAAIGVLRCNFHDMLIDAAAFNVLRGAAIVSPRVQENRLSPIVVRGFCACPNCP